MMRVPTYKECVEFTKTHPAFREKVEEVDGFRVSVFFYDFMVTSDFSDYPGMEMRGICFFHLRNGRKKVFPSMRKFFSVGQHPGWTLDRLRVLEPVLSIQTKYDGSLVTFVKSPAGTVRAKTIKTFYSWQAEAANRIYRDNADVKSVVDIFMQMDSVPMFEYTSPDNRVVVKYSKEELKLVAGRHCSTFEYFSPATVEALKTQKHTSFVNCWYTIDKVVSAVEKVETEEDVRDTGIKEGFVVTMSDNTTRVKVKTPWYLSTHRAVTSSDRIDEIVFSVLEDRWDDLASQFQTDDERFESVLKVADTVSQYMASVSRDVETAVYEVKMSSETPKDFFERISSDPKRSSNVHVYMSVFNHFGQDGFDAKTQLSRKVAKDCRRLEMARNFLNTAAKYNQTWG